MKIYTHPDIILPAGTVVVKFYDKNGSGSETTPNIIEAIGDTEDGFDYQLGDYVAKECEFTFWNKDNYALDLIMDVPVLKVSVVVSGDLYFYGEIYRDTIDIDDDANRISITAIDGLASLQKISLSAFKTKLSGYPGYFNTDYFYLREVFRVMAEYADLKYSSVLDSVDYKLSRKYKYDNGLDMTIVNMNNIAININYFDDVDTYENAYSNVISNTLELLALYMRDFFFYPMIYFDGTDLRLRILERDYEQWITLPSIIEENRAVNYVVKTVKVTLDNILEGTSLTSLDYGITEPDNLYGDSFELKHKHTNIARSYTDGDGNSYSTNLMLWMRNASSGLNQYIEEVENPGGSFYTSFHNAIYNAYKNKYYNRSSWRELILRGLKPAGGTIDQLMPGSRFTRDGATFMIHKVKKSLMKNRSEITALNIS